MHRLKKAVHWIVDYSHMLKGVSVMYFKRTPPKHYLEHVVADKSPIIILPGIFNRWAFVKPLADYLSLLGHPIYVVPKLGNNIADIPDSAKKVKDVIDENNLKDIVILAHSKGGLVGKYLLTEDKTESLIRGMVAIATPFSGSAIGKLIPHTSVRELLSNSRIIQLLNKNKKFNHKIISIIPEYDNHIWHKQGSFLEGALENIRVSTKGHHKIINDKQVFRIVAESIEKLGNIK